MASQSDKTYYEGIFGDDDDVDLINLNTVKELQAAIAERDDENERLRAENGYLRTWIMMETGVDEQHISDVLSAEASLSDVVKNRYG